MSSPTAGSLLIVRHGPGRGRGRSFGAPMLDYLENNRSELWTRIVRWETGNPLPDLDGVHAVLFWLADPLRELYPDCFEQAMLLEAEARLRGVRTINPPQALSNTIKSVQSSRWQAAGIPAARCSAFRDHHEYEACLREAEFPAIVRPDLLHSQADTHFFRTREAAKRLDRSALTFPFDADERKMDLARGERVDLAAGDFLMFHSMVPHRSGPNRSGASLRGLFLTYSTARHGDVYARFHPAAVTG